jgi:hypothetical protein
MATQVGRSADGATTADRGHAPASGFGAVRRSTETKAAFKTTEFIAYIAVLAGIFIAGLVVDAADGTGFTPDQVWLYATILTFGYMVSRGIAKSGSRDPYTDDSR